MYLYGLGGYFFKDTRDWSIVVIDPVNTFQAIIKEKTLLPNRKMVKNPDNPNINIHKIETILLAFQI